jgi:hypothetical protein
VVVAVLVVLEAVLMSVDEEVMLEVVLASVDEAVVTVAGVVDASSANAETEPIMPLAKITAVPAANAPARDNRRVTEVIE